LLQEGLGFTAVNLGVLGNKVVPNYSSLVDGQHEHAETIQDNHMDMRRFFEADDPNYRKVSGELRLIYLSSRICTRRTSNRVNLRGIANQRRMRLSLAMHYPNKLKTMELAKLKSLFYKFSSFLV
jgi:hypothetical protein